MLHMVEMFDNWLLLNQRVYPRLSDTGFHCLDFPLEDKSLELLTQTLQCIDPGASWYGKKTEVEVVVFFRREVWNNVKFEMLQDQAIQNVNAIQYKCLPCNSLVLMRSTYDWLRDQLAMFRGSNGRRWDHDSLAPPFVWKLGCPKNWSSWCPVWSGWVRLAKHHIVILGVTMVSYWIWSQVVSNGLSIR